MLRGGGGLGNYEIYNLRNAISNILHGVIFCTIPEIIKYIVKKNPVAMNSPPILINLQLVLFFLWLTNVAKLVPGYLPVIQSW